MTIVFLISLAALAYIRLVYPRRFGLLAKTAFRLQILRQVMREELLFSHRSSLVLFAHFIVMTSIIIYAAVNYFGVISTSQTGIAVFLIILMSVLMVYLLKFLLMGFLKWVYADRGLIREYRFEVFSISKILGLFYLPISILVVTQNVERLNWIFLFAAFLFLISVIWRTIQGLIMSFSYTVSPIYIILYLCTFEISPFVLFISFFL
ncbi:MAG: DUF4271 domain-containing protein [Flavobacteriales bacterium]|nr:DUF4271 domain-containing protein [Flavobacteriales bacterium]